MQVDRITVLVIMSLCAVVACTQHVSSTLDTTADEAALRAADEAVNHGCELDDETVAALYAEDAVILPDGEPAVRGRKAIREWVKASIAANRKAGECTPLTLSDRAVGVSGDLGWSSGVNKVIGPGGAITWSGKYLSVSRKVNGKWLYIRDTWNSDAPTPAPNPPEPPTK